MTDLLEKYGLMNLDENKKTNSWATETGYYSTPANEASRASWMVRLLALNRIGDEHGAYHEKMFLYNMFNHGFDHSDSEDNYGLCCSWKDKKWNERSAYAAKEPYLTVAQWNKMMTEAVLTDYTVTDDTSGKLRYQAEFDRDGDKVTLLWDVYEYDEAVTLSGYDDTNQIKVYDIYGNILQELSGEKSIALKAQNTPVYVEFTNEAIYAEADGSKITSLSGMTGKSVSFNADLKEAAQKRMLIAKYDKTGILISVATKKLDESGKASMQNTIEADVFYKLMLWDFEKLKPYCEAVVLRH